MRALVASAAMVGALAALLWLLALVTSTPPPATAMFLLGEPLAVVGEPWAVRFGAAQEGSAGPSRLRGTVALAGASVDAAPGYAHLIVASTGPAPGALAVCLDDGAPCVEARFSIPAVASRPATRARLSWLGPEPPVPTLASVARRTGLALRMPLELDAAAPAFTVQLERTSGPLLLDIVVDGVVRDLVAATGTSVEVPTPSGLRPGSVVVVHAGGPWPEDVGAWAIGRAHDPAEPLGVFAARLAQQAGAPADLGVPADEAAAGALLQRLRPAALRAGRLPLEVLPNERGPPWAELYLAAATALVALVALAGRTRRVPALPLAAGVGAVAAACAGMYVVLLLVGR